MSTNSAAPQISVAKAAEEAKSHATWNQYKWVSYAMIVGCFGVGINAFSAGHPDQVPYKAYPHMHIRRKAFPWNNGDGASLFHDDHFNVYPGVGYKGEH